MRDRRQKESICARRIMKSIDVNWAKGGHVTKKRELVFIPQKLLHFKAEDDVMSI